MGKKKLIKKLRKEILELKGRSLDELMEWKIQVGKVEEHDRLWPKIEALKLEVEEAEGVLRKTLRFYADADETGDVFDEAKAFLTRPRDG